MINISELNINESFIKLKAIEKQNHKSLLTIEKYQKSTTKAAKNLQNEINIENIIKYSYCLLEYEKLVSQLLKPLNEIENLRKQITSRLSLSWIASFINIFREIKQNAIGIANTIDSLCSENTIKMSFEKLTADKDLELSNKLKLACEKILIAKEDKNLNSIKNDLNQTEKEALSMIEFIISHVEQKGLQICLLNLLKEPWIGEQGQSMKLVFRKLQSANEEEISCATRLLLNKLCVDYQNKLEAEDNNLNVYQLSFYQKSNPPAISKKDSIVTQWKKYLSLPLSLRLLLEDIDNAQLNMEHFFDSFKALKKDIKNFFQESTYQNFITTQLEPALIDYPEIQDFLLRISEGNRSKNESLKLNP